MATNLGVLEKVQLREAWKHEAHDFTNWLAKEENLASLSDEIGIDISLIRTEANVGKFNVDILAQEEHSGRKIIIENQLEITDHDHLGKIITYASGYDAEIIIWIVKEVREEHRQAVEWLNEHTESDINFFAIKMELWKIGESLFAPKFQVICKPNEWTKAIKPSNSNDLSETKLMQLKFWEDFNEYCENKNTRLRLRKPYPQHYYELSLGFSDACITLAISNKDNQLICELYIPDNKELYCELEKQKNNIESELNQKLEWCQMEGKKASRIKLSKEFELNTNEQKAFSWLEEKAVDFQKVFFTYIQQIKHS